jgi:hypothetical protein
MLLPDETQYSRTYFKQHFSYHLGGVHVTTVITHRSKNLPCWDQYHNSYSIRLEDTCPNLPPKGMQHVGQPCRLILRSIGSSVTINKKFVPFKKFGLQVPVFWVHFQFSSYEFPGTYTDFLIGFRVRGGQL